MTPGGDSVTVIAIKEEVGRVRQRQPLPAQCRGGGGGGRRDKKIGLDFGIHDSHRSPCEGVTGMVINAFSCTSQGRSE